MSTSDSRMLLLVAIAVGSLLMPVLAVGCAEPTGQPTAAAVEQPTGDGSGSVDQGPAGAPDQEASPPAESVALKDPVGALSLIRMAESPDPSAPGTEQFPGDTGIWIAFYALGKGASETDEYVLRVVDDAGAIIAEVPIYGPGRRVPDDGQSTVGTGGLVDHAAVPVFGAGEPLAAGDYRSVIMLNGNAEAEIAWSVKP